MTERSDALCPESARSVVLVRVGIDSGCGGIQGPLFDDDTFEFIPIPDGHGLDSRTYGNTVGRAGRPFADFFAASRQPSIAQKPMHVDPEWTTFTYGDPTPPKAVLSRLKPGDLLVFYCGLQRWHEDTGWDGSSRAALYLAGYFHVTLAGLASDFSQRVLDRQFRENFHVRHASLLQEQRERLVLVKGDPRQSRLFHKAHCISAEGRDRNGTPLKVLSPTAQTIFGDFDGRISIQRSTPRWVSPAHVETAIAHLKSLDCIEDWDLQRAARASRGRSL